MIVQYLSVKLDDIKYPFVSVQTPAGTDRLVGALSGRPDVPKGVAWISFEVENLFDLELPPLCAKYYPTQR